MSRNTEKMVNMRNAHCMYVKKLKKVENEKHTLYDLEYGQKH